MTTSNKLHTITASFSDLERPRHVIIIHSTDDDDLMIRREGINACMSLISK